MGKNPSAAWRETRTPFPQEGFGEQQIQMQGAGARCQLSPHMCPDLSRVPEMPAENRTVVPDCPCHYIQVVTPRCLAVSLPSHPNWSTWNSLLQLPTLCSLLNGEITTRGCASHSAPHRLFLQQSLLQEKKAFFPPCSPLSTSFVWPQIWKPRANQLSLSWQAL